MKEPMTALWAVGCAATLACTTLAAKSRAEIAPTQIPAAPLMLLAQQEPPQAVEPQAAEPEHKGTKTARKPTPQAAPPSQSPAALASPPPSSPSPTAEAPIPQTPAAAIGEFQPVLHAQEAKITTCMDTIVAESAAVIDSAHTAVSSWATHSPNESPFVSIIGQRYANKAAPNAADVIFATPVGPDRCEGEIVQVYPLAQSCSAIQASLIKEGRTIAMVQALPVIETKAGFRDILLPTAGGGCVVVAVGWRR